MLPLDATEPPPEAPREIPVAGLSRPVQPWLLRLYRDGLRLTPRAGAPVIHLLRAELPTHVLLLDSGFTRRTLVVRKPLKRNFKLDPPGWSALTEWVGRDARLRMALRQRLAFGIPLGTLLVFAALLPPATPEAAGVAGRIWTATLGALLVAGAALARWRPHRVLLLMDCALIAVVAGSIVFRLAHGASPLWIILIVMQLLFVWSGVSLYRELAPSADRSGGDAATGGAPP